MRQSTARGRRWRVPPAMLETPDETLEGCAVLDEIGGEFGTLLWQSHRDVMLWAATREDARSGLFDEGAYERRRNMLHRCAASREVRHPLMTLARVLDGSGRMTAAAVADACIAVAEWAVDKGAFRTALAFAQAAALVRVDLAGPALLAGRLAMRLRETARADTWFRRSIALARRGHDRATYASAYVELAKLRKGSGELEASEAAFVKALKAARRCGAKEVRGAATLGLMRLARVRGRLPETMRWAAAAIRANRRDTPEHREAKRTLASAALDLALPALARRVLDRELREELPPSERMQTLALLVRASAGLGDQDQLESAWRGAWALIQGHRNETQAVARALSDLVRAGTDAAVIPGAAAIAWRAMDLASSLGITLPTPPAPRGPPFPHPPTTGGIS